MQVPALRQWLQAEGCVLEPADHAHFRARAPGLVLTCYRSGKALAQGQALAGWAPRIDALLGGRGTERSTAPSPPRGPEPGASPAAARGAGERPATGLPDKALWPGEPDGGWHAGSDESGKGDYFGPLVVVAVAVRPDDLPWLDALGIRDSKVVAAGRHGVLAEAVEARLPWHAEVLLPEAYNAAWAEVRNVNRLLDAMHARCLAALAGQREVTSMLTDQYSPSSRIPVLLRSAGLGAAAWRQQPRAESDPAVAAASVVARAHFEAGLAALSAEVGVDLHPGAGEPTLRSARALVRVHGPQVLARVAKAHFRTTLEVAPGWTP
jgi:ribonuclease HIII